MAPRTRSAQTAEAPAEPPEVIDFASMNLATRIQKARELLGGGIKKEGKNTQVGDGYSYVKATDVSRAVYDALARVGVYAQPSYEEVGVPLEFNSRSGAKQFLTRIKVTIVVGKVEDKMGGLGNVPGAAEVITKTTIGHGADNSDKGPYKAMTGGLKYALLHLLGLATDDDPEATIEREPAPAAVRVGPQSAAEASAPPETTVVGSDPEAPITVAQSKLIFAKSNEAGLNHDQFRTLVYLVTQQRSSKNLKSKDVDSILAALQDPTMLTSAKQEQSFDATVGQTPDPTKSPEAEADRIAAEAAALTGGEVVTA